MNLWSINNENTVDTVVYDRHQNFYSEERSDLPIFKL